MRLRNILFALLVGLAPRLTPAQQAVRDADHSLSQAAATQVAIIKGRVSGSDEDPLPATIVIEGDGLTKPVRTEDGRFQIEVPPGVYTARVEPSSSSGKVDKRIEYAPFLVRAGETAEIEVDPLYEEIYCSPSGERVVPVRASHGEDENLKGLRRPGYESFEVAGSGKAKLKIVFQHCGRTEVGGLIRYRSLAMGIDKLRLTAASATFDPRTQKLNGRRVYVPQHGPASEVPLASVYMWDGKIILNLAVGVISSIKGAGAINSGRATFDFKIGKNGGARFEYVDQAKGLRLTSTKRDRLIVIPPSGDRVSFRGSAIVTSRGLNAPRGNVVDYIVTLQDYGHENKTRDRFSIAIPSLKNYQESGRLTEGDIEVSGASRSFVRDPSTPLRSFVVPTRGRRP